MDNFLNISDLSSQNLEDNEDSLDTIASKVHELEYANFPKVIHSLLYKEKK